MPEDGRSEAGTPPRAPQFLEASVRTGIDKQDPVRRVGGFCYNPRGLLALATKRHDRVAGRPHSEEVLLTACEAQCPFG
ncbi:13661_t:CDS:2 [Acaulospora colombiana]|uniref:13661_t:CDS:1 n=1 Tax=Acaulospora colombiana TaxID=27376 RepID=A0ACA9P0C3_9GLOM|nr:13661_t:CDS:2 [Acaulospora colombiana]